jgi:phage terminase large subunit-like protein
MGVLSQVAEFRAGARADPRLAWRETARPEQLLPPGSDWRVCYWQGGRGAGKNASCSNAMAEWVLGDTEGEGEYGIIAPTYADAWTKCVEGKTGILKALGTSMSEVKDHRSATVRSAWRTYGQVILHNGIIIYVDSAAEGGLRVQGRNLRGAWCSEIGLWDKWETAWKESVNYAVREGRSQIIADGTPKASRKARKLIRGLIRNDREYGGVIVRKLRTRDNIANLSEAFVRAVVGGFRGTRLEMQELEGELLDDVANALWTRELLDSVHVYELPFLRTIYLGVDPSDGNEDSDEQAYTLVGLGMPDDGHIYVAENWGGQEAPAPFAKRCIRKAVEWNATIVVERNHGGAWLKEVFAQAQRELGTSVRVKVIWASQAKRTRAEPVSLMYDRYAEDGRPLVLHYHNNQSKPCDCYDGAHPDGHSVPDEHMPELEDQMATFTGAAGERSPDRLDSLVWAASPLLRTSFGAPVPAKAAHYQQSDEEAEYPGIDKMTADTGRTSAERKMREIHDRARGQSWEVDTFAPQVPDGDGDRPPASGNVHKWR